MLRAHRAPRKRFSSGVPGVGLVVLSTVFLRITGSRPRYSFDGSLPNHRESASLFF